MSKIVHTDVNAPTPCLPQFSVYLNLNVTVRHYPDPLITEQFREIYDESYTDVLKQRCAICVWSPSIRYGTRYVCNIVLGFWHKSCLCI